MVGDILRLVWLENGEGRRMRKGGGCKNVKIFIWRVIWVEVGKIEDIIVGV